MLDLSLFEVALSPELPEELLEPALLAFVLDAVLSPVAEVPLLLSDVSFLLPLLPVRSLVVVVLFASVVALDVAEDALADEVDFTTALDVLSEAGGATDGMSSERQRNDDQQNHSNDNDQKDHTFLLVFHVHTSLLSRTTSFISL